MPRIPLNRRTRRRLVRSLVILLSLSLVLIARQELWQPRTISQNLETARSVLWVTAHPDDESFFFAPSITNLIGEGSDRRGNLLCLSVGGYEGLGSIRERELKESCRVLNIDDDRCIALDHPELPDDPSVAWSAELTTRIVEEHVAKWNVDAIITFDSHGVSGHANHRAIHDNLLQAVQSKRLTIPVYAVRSTDILSKYTSIALLPLALLRHVAATSLSRSRRDSSLFLNSFEQFAIARRSFGAHASQARWFRTLFVSASRYLWYIELERI
ncbi:hypothetical protein JCM10212_005471 [Sporobolomyces blumeae]